MYFYIYKTTNLKNNKIYIGQHSSKKLNDGYLGSGNHLRKSIEKYGKHNFIREIICFCDSHEQLDYVERLLVDKNFVNRKDTYNRALGGDGGFSHAEESKEKISQASLEFWNAMSDTEFEIHINKIKLGKQKYFNNLSDHEKFLISERLKKNWHKNPKRSENTSLKFTETMIDYWSTMSDEDYDNLIIRRKQNWIDTPLEKKLQMSNNKKIFWNSRTIDEWDKTIERRKKSLDNRSNEEKYNSKQRHLDSMRVVGQKRKELFALQKYQFRNHNGIVFIGTFTEFFLKFNIDDKKKRALKYRGIKRLGWEIPILIKENIND